MPFLHHIATHLFRDDDCWPLGSSLFYLGLLPPVLPPTQSSSTLLVAAHWLVTCVAHSCHLTAIWLAGRIWGVILCQFSQTQTPPTAGLPVGLRRSPPSLTLPPHLHHFLHP